jgi:Arc/MetJ-type ribon-helix-helix transcriptional regulator
MPKKVLVALPNAMVEMADYVAAAEHRNRSDLVRESLRRYFIDFKQQQASLSAPKPNPEPALQSG